MKTILKISFALITFTLLLTACKKDDKNITKEKKLTSIVAPPNNEGKRMVVNYRYDDHGRLIEIVQEKPYLVFFTITYMPDGRVEKIKVLKDFFDQKYVDFTFFYESESKIPNRIRYSGAVPTYTADIVNIDNTLFWNNEDGDEFVLEAINTTNNTFKSLVAGGVTITPYFSTQLKNGLATQAVLNIPFAMIPGYEGIMLYMGLQLNSKPITKLETSSGELYNWQYETDAAGYITKDKFQGGIEYRYQ